MMSQKEKLDHGVRADKLGWKFMGETNPQITTQDQLQFDFMAGDAHTVKVTADSRPRSADIAFYRVFGEEDDTET
jgi:hypothetical protein